MKHYPSIEGTAKKYGPMPLGEYCYAFHKYDGSNIRCEWNKKRGWYKFGSRNQLIADDCPMLGTCQELFLKKYAEPVERVLKNHPVWKTAIECICYVEFYGPHSFAGWHDAETLGVESNDPKDVMLFDVNVHKRGFVSPKDFIKEFGSSMEIAKLVWQGQLTQQFVDDVRSGVYGTDEGVIVKGGQGHHLWMRKIKTLPYLERLKKMFGQDWEKYWE